MYRLVSKRINDLCSLFTEIPKERIEQTWSIVYHILNNERDLMQDRHIDHLIMCSMYAICNKMYKMKIAFKDIIFNYRCICENNRQISSVEIGKVTNFFFLILEKGTLANSYPKWIHRRHCEIL